VNYLITIEKINTWKDCKNYSKFQFQGQSGRATIDFSNKNAVRALTKALLAKDFNLCVEIPENKLVPTLPLRLNYILWIEDLLKWKGDEPSAHKIHGIDIGK
jgi:U6 snRNA m6A methyltransferase